LALSKKLQDTLKRKARLARIPYGIIKEVYERGMAAWLTGSRPGIGMNQWAMARVNSFIRGSKKHDTDLRSKY
tara:strand:+ start:394 stop:612 length:219 start_codon:yes stop_codon:yes gene_type:complete